MVTDPDTQHAFDKLGLKFYATIQEIDRTFRRAMLKIHPDKSGYDSCQDAQAYMEFRDLARRFASDPKYEKYRTDSRNHDQAAWFANRAMLFERMRDLMAEEISKLHRQCIPDHGARPSEDDFAIRTRHWTPHQRREAEDAIQFGLGDGRDQLDRALEELETLRAENARLRAPTALSDAVDAVKAAEAALADEQRRAYDLAVRLETETSRANDLDAALASAQQHADAVDAELVQCKRCLEECSAREKQWEQKFIAKLMEADEFRTQLNEQRREAEAELPIHPEQMLKDADSRVEETGARAKEWEQKCLMLQERLNEILTQTAQREVQHETERRSSKKRRNRNNDQHLEYSKLIREFVIAHTETNFNKPDTFLSTKTLYETFQKHYRDQQPQDFNLLHFAAEFSKHIQDIYPSASRSRNNSNKGYIGFRLK